MSAGRRDFLSRYSEAWAARADRRRRSGGAADLRIASALERIVAGMRAELTALPVAAPIATEPVDVVTWRSPVFNAGGCFNPFAGTRQEQMLATAALMEARGHSDLAERYREHAAADPEILHVKVDPVAAVEPLRRSRRSRPTWSGPNMPPPDPTPFVAGPQMEFFA